MSEPYHVLNLGAGVNSTALLLYLVENKMPLQEVVFADPGAEMPKTYEYLPRIEKFCSEHQIAFTIVKSHLGSLLTHCLKEHIIPARKLRWCTDKWKKIPIRKHLADHPNRTHYFGIAADESHRAHASDRRSLTYKYPLVEAGIDRLGCVEIIERYGWPVPVKSGCFFCPFTSLKGWQYLYLNHPEKYTESEKLEENNHAYPAYLLSTRPLSSLKNRFGDGSAKIEEWFYAPKCESGYCFV